MKKVLEKDVGFDQFQKISNILNGQNVISSSDLPLFKFTPIISVDEERSFYNYKNIFADNRRSFKYPNLRKYLIIQCT
jgi:hypothetical protein